MRTHDFGGFSTRTCSIDLRFGSPDQFDHFVQAWGRRGRPNLEAVPSDRWMEMISIGTTLEHELRHYHDFLLCYVSLHNYWLRLQAMMNAAPVLGRMLKSSCISQLVFPAMEWAKIDLSAREAYLADALGGGDALSQTWSPPIVTGPKPSIGVSEPILSFSEETYRHSLFVLRDQMDMITRMRSGITDPHFPFPFTPRFVSELSSLLVQCASVQQTYGLTEMDLFLNRLAADGSLYARFFSPMILALSSASARIPGEATSVIDSKDVDWRALGVAVSWCFCGSSAHPQLLSPANRMAGLLKALEEDRQALFPPMKSFSGLLDHLDTHFGVEPAREAARRNGVALRGFLQRSSAKVATAGKKLKELRPFLEIFEALLDERDRVVARIFDFPEGYMDPGRYVRALPDWPQCPVSMDFRPAGIVVYKEVLHRLGDDPVFSDTYDERGCVIEDAVVEVSYQSFLPGGSAFPLRTARALADHRDIFDMFFDPQQIDAEKEQQIRQLISKQYGKKLIRFIS